MFVDEINLSVSSGAGGPGSVSFNNLNSKDPVAMNLFSQKDLILALEKAERRIKREKKEKEKAKLSQ